jgi:hypothetical protein
VLAINFLLGLAIPSEGGPVRLATEKVGIAKGYGGGKNRTRYPPDMAHGR